MEGKIALVALLGRYKNITLEKEDYKMTSKFLYLPEKIKVTLEKKWNVLERKGKGKWKK